MSEGKPSGEPDAKILVVADDADNNNEDIAPSTTTPSSVRRSNTTSSNKASLRSTEDATADRTDRFLNRKAERNSGKGSKQPEQANVPGAQRIGASSNSSNDVVMKKVRINDVGAANDEPNNSTATGEGGVPLAAEISDIHEENERLRRQLLDERNQNEEVGAGTTNNPNIPVAQVLPGRIGPIVGDVDEEDNQEECWRPTKTNIACMVLCFAVVLGAVLGIVVSANSGSKTVVVVEEGSTSPSSPPTWTQIPSSSPSETPPWLFVAEKVFEKDIEKRISNEEFLELLSQSPHGIVWRQCPNCTSTAHQNIFYKRLTDPPSEERDFNGEIPSHFLDLFLNNWYSAPKNALNVDFELYSTYEDALDGKNKWQYCNYDQKKIGFPRDCAPDDTAIAPKQWASFLGNDRYGAGVDHIFYVENYNVPTAQPTIQPSTVPTNLVPVTILPSSQPTGAWPTIVIGCREGEVAFEFVILTDFFGAETTWDLKGPTGNTIASGGPYGDFQRVGIGLRGGSSYCIPVESCYSLTIYDEFGDGIYSPGGYRVSLADTVIVDVVGGTKFTARTIDIAATVVTYSYGETVITQNCEDVPIETRCSLEDFMGEEFLGRIGQEISYSVTIGESFTQKDMRTDTQSLVGSFESLEGNIAFYSGGNFCEGGQRSGTVELVESSQVDSVQTFFSQPSDCTFAVEITVPACKTT